MTATACIRILVDAPPAGVHPAALAALVAKVVGARLETSWAWPRRHGLVAPFTFILADPNVERLDPKELIRLTAELQRTLFGTEAAGKVALMLFEGAQSAVMRLAAASLEQIQAILSDQNEPAFPGRIVRVTAAAAQDIGAERAALHLRAAASGAEETPIGDISLPAFQPNEPADVGFWSVYLLLSERFIGSAVNWPPMDGNETPSMIDARESDSDLEHLERLASFDHNAANGYIFLPLGYSTLVRPKSRDAYIARLMKLNGLRTLKLALNIYAVPRSLSYGAVSDIKNTLKPSVSLINLLIEDPDFDVATVPVGVVESVTLVLNGANEVQNLASLARFGGHAATYRGHRIWQGAARIQTKRELEACLRSKIPFLSGPAVAGLTRKPAGQIIWPCCNLPYVGWTNEGALSSVDAHRAEMVTLS